LELVNSKITQLNKETEQNIDNTQEENERVVEELHELEDKLDSYAKLIEAKERLNKENFQILITKTEELEQFRHRKEYIEKLIETETCSQKELIRNYGEIDSILQMKREKLQLVEQ
jgi:predicted transcriptional regulator